MLFDAPSNSDVALSDLTYTNGGNDHARQGKSSAFPAIWRPKQENTTAVVSDDDILSVVNTSNTGVLPPPQEKKSDALAPRPETRRLGYFSVAALIINRMIGGNFLIILLFVSNSCAYRHWHFLDAWFSTQRDWW